MLSDPAVQGCLVVIGFLFVLVCILVRAVCQLGEDAQMRQREALKQDPWRQMMRKQKGN